MAHYAFLDENNIVTEVITGIEETEQIDGLDTETWYGQFRGQTCKRTSYNNKIRGHYAAIGHKYDATLDIFVAPQPYPSWVMLPDGFWTSPLPYPTDEKRYEWDESTENWVEVTE